MRALSHLLPAGEHHENHFLSAVRLLRVKSRRAAVQRLGEDHARYSIGAARDLRAAVEPGSPIGLLREFMAQDDIAPLAMEGVLLEMLAESARSSDEIHGSSAPTWLRRVRESLEDSYLEVARSGRRSRPSRECIRCICRASFTGTICMTVGEYIRKRRIEHASELLIEIRSFRWPRSRTLVDFPIKAISALSSRSTRA